MQTSFYLTFIALFASLAYGFSSQACSTFRRTAPPKSGAAPQQLVLHSKKPFSSLHSPALALRGGSSAIKQSSSPIDTGSKCPMTGAAALFGSLYATFGVLYILGKAIKRVLPIALEPFSEGAVPLSQFQLGAYIVTCLWFAYVEGYKGFQTKFSPLVVKRSFTLIPGKNNTTWYHFLLAPLYGMGMIHATRKRMIVSWSVTLGVSAIVVAVKKLPYPWRNIIDAGVVVGLTWGSLSILILYLKAWITGQTPTNVDASLPAMKKE